MEFSLETMQCPAKKGPYEKAVNAEANTDAHPSTNTPNQNKPILPVQYIFSETFRGDSP